MAYLAPHVVAPLTVDGTADGWIGVAAEKMTNIAVGAKGALLSDTEPGIVVRVVEIDTDNNLVRLRPNGSRAFAGDVSAYDIADNAVFFQEESVVPGEEPVTGSSGSTVVTSALGPEDFWDSLQIGSLDVTKAPTPFISFAQTNGTVTLAQAQAGKGAAAHWDIQCANTGAFSGRSVVWGSEADIYRMYPGLMVRTRFEPTTITAQTRRGIGFIDNATNLVGAAFFFTGATVGASVAGVAASFAAPPTIIVGESYIFEVEIEASAAVFRVYDGITGELSWEESVAFTIPTDAVRFLVYQGVFVVNPGSAVSIDKLYDVAVGTRSGYDAHNTYIAP